MEEQGQGNREIIKESKSLELITQEISGGMNEIVSDSAQIANTVTILPQKTEVSRLRWARQPVVSCRYLLTIVLRIV